MSDNLVLIDILTHGKFSDSEFLGMQHGIKIPTLLG